MIYYYHNDEIPLFLIMAYVKSHKESLDAKERADLRRLARMLVDTYQGKQEDV